MATATATKPVASPRNIEAARQRAVAACAAAYAPHDVLQPDGSALQLCWQGRVRRAWQQWEEAQKNGSEERAMRIAQAATALVEAANLAQTAAAQAVAEYKALVEAANQPMDNVMPAACACEQCRAAEAQQAYFRAESNLRQTVAALMEPNRVTDMPALVALVDGAADQKTRELLWRQLKRIADAQKAYRKACDEFGQTPQWARAMHGESW